MGIKQKVKGALGEISDKYYLMRAKSVETKNIEILVEKESWSRGRFPIRKRQKLMRFI